MDSRIALVCLFLLLRLILNIFQINKCDENQLIRVAGIVKKIYHSESERILVIGDFRAKFLKNVLAKEGNYVSVIGRCRKGVIGTIYGQIGLVDPVISVIEERSRKELWLTASVRKLRQEINKDLRKQLPSTESGLLAGIVLGDKDSIGVEFSNALINSGTIHIAVASGFNVTVVGAAVMLMLNRFLKRRWSTILAIVAIIFYVLLAGGEPPITRAAIMGSLVLVAKVYGRQAGAGYMLLIASAVMTFVRPSILGEVSFQLSVAATAGLIFLEPIIKGYFEGLRNGLIQILMRLEFSTTLSAQIVTAPIIWWHFRTVNLIGLISNLFVLPLIPPAMALGGVQIAMNLIWEPLGRLVAPLSYALLHLVVFLVRLFG